MSDAVYLAAGRALAQAHRFERNLKGLATLVQSVHEVRDPLFDPTTFSKLSIGPLVDSIRRVVDFDDRIPALLEEARNRRNALCHTYFEDHKEAMGTEEGRSRIVEDLRQSESLFDDAADFCSGVLGLLVGQLEQSLKTAEP